MTLILAFILDAIEGAIWTVTYAIEDASTWLHRTAAHLFGGE